MLVIALLAAPVLAGVACRLLWRRQRLVEALNVVGAALTLALGAAVVVEVARDGWLRAARGLFYVDALSAVMIAAIVVVGSAAALVSVGYMRNDLAARHVPEGRRGLGWYYLGLHVFVATMLATVTVDNLGLLWVGVEATTLASALLVGFYRTKAAIEAAWKYVILCTVGITFALFGVLLTYNASVRSGGGRGLDWSELSLRAGQLDGDMMRLAFVFVLIGFGTKAGFAPLHTWLADAHSQAPSPVSGVLSGVLLSCALYAILRFHALTTAATGGDFSGNLLLAFGVLSVAVAAPFVLVQRDLKRLLAYSSVEHIGLMAVAFGIGGALGVYAGVLHLVNHAATKSLLFFAAGDVVQRFGTRRISAIRGALRVAPLTGWLLLLGVFAITGGPPSGVFVSELAIAGAGFGGGRWRVAAVVAVVLLLGVIFAGMLAQTLRLAYGPPHVTRESNATAGRDWWSNAPQLAALAPLAAIVLLFGVYLPDPVSELFDDVAAIVDAPAETASRP
jgi:hydrogenase-4 component F